MALTAHIGDRYHFRGSIFIVNSLIALIGLPIMGFAASSGARYFGVLLAIAGTNAIVPTALAHRANNVRGQWKRAFCSALFVNFGGIGGISVMTMFRSQDAPRYTPGISVAIAYLHFPSLLLVSLIRGGRWLMEYGCSCNCLVIVCVLGLSGKFVRANRQADRGKRIIK